MLAQARDYALYRDGNHWKMDFEAFDKDDGPRLDLKS